MAYKYPVLAASPWPSNGALIRDVARLGYLHSDWGTFDATYGKGNWWTLFRPKHLVCNNINEGGQDFRDTDYADDLFQAIAFDPAYISVGGRKTSGIKVMHQSYGMDDAAKSPALLQAHNDHGLTEMHRICQKNGYVITKCMDYVSSGKLWLGTHHTLSHALALGFECVDRMEHIGTPGPQPTKSPGGTPRRQVHARRNLSTMFILRKR